MRYEEETEQMRLGFHLWVQLGKGRTYKAVAKQLKVDDAAVGFWAKFFKWGDRLKLMEDAGVVTSRSHNMAAVAPVDDETQGKLKQLSEQLGGVVNKGFENLAPAMEAGLILGIAQLTKLTKEHRETLIALRRGGQTTTPGTPRIDNLTLVLNNMSQEDRIALFTRPVKIADVPGGDQPAPADCAEADYVEVPDGGAQDAGGCDGVSGGIGGGEGGVEGELPPRGPRISLLRFE